jgi:hypothetical protein
LKTIHNLLITPTNQSHLKHGKPALLKATSVLLSKTPRYGLSGKEIALKKKQKKYKPL